MMGILIETTIDARGIAGARITTQFISALGDDLVIDIKNKIAATPKELEVLDYVYVIDDRKKLLGVASADPFKRLC